MTATVGSSTTTALPAPPGVGDPRGPSRTRPSLTPTVTAGIAVLLASLSLSPLLTDLGWLGWSTVMVLVVAAVGGGLERIRAPLLLVPLAQTAAGLAVMLFAFVPDAPWGVLPSPDALVQLRSVLQDGLVAVQSYAAPAPTSTGLVALVTLGVGVCAMTTHVLSVTLRTPVLTALPLVALYTVPAAILTDGAPWWAFVLVAAAWLAILVVDARQQVSAWGQLVSHPGARATGAVPRGAWTGPATRIGLLATAVALVVPPLVPGLTSAVLGGRGSGSSPSSATDPDSIALDPFVSMRRDLQQGQDVELFTYRTDATRPAYLRTVVATTFDGENWLPETFSADDSPIARQAVVTPVGLGPDVATTTADYRLQSIRLDGPYLPLPYPVTRISAPDAWHWDNEAAVAFSTSSTSKGTSWAATALDPTPSVAQLQAATSQQPGPEALERRRPTQLLRLPQQLVDLAHEVTDGYRTPYAKALALQWWFRTQFTYSLDVKGDPNADQLTAFLTDRTGYCQQFAATMALMARALDIQSRVAVGFTPGTEDATGLWHVSTQDAHAWPELYFSGLGWVRFEPTPRASSDGGNVAVPAWARQDTLEQLRRDDPDGAVTRPTPSAATDALDAAAADADAAPVATRVRRGLVVAAVAVLLLAALAPAAVRLRRRRRRLRGHGPGSAEAGWAELRDTVTDLGLAWSDADTPRQAGARLLRAGWADDEVTAAVHRLTGSVEQARYAPPGAPRPVRTAADLRRVRAGLERRVDRGTRWRARLLPPSVLRRD